MGGPAHYEVWAGRYGAVIVADDGQAWAGDLCYMEEKFGWSHAQYMAAYGRTPDTDATQVYLTDRLQVHATDDGKYIIVIPVGGDGAGPIGLGFDTGSCSFVSTDRTRVEAMRAACLDYLGKET